MLPRYNSTTKRTARALICCGVDVWRMLVTDRSIAAIRAESSSHTREIRVCLSTAALVSLFMFFAFANFSVRLKIEINEIHKIFEIQSI